MGRYILCPFFKNEKKGRPTISCEDCIRYFGTVEKREAYFKKYCEANWEGCPGAKRLNEMYERIDKMQDEKSKKIEMLSCELKASEGNNRKLLADIGREKARREKAEKKVEEMNRVAESNFSLFRNELEGMRGKLDLERKRREWAESALAAVLIEQHKEESEFEIDTEKIGAALLNYRLELQATYDGKTIAKVISNGKV